MTDIHLQRDCGSMQHPFALQALCHSYIDMDMDDSIHPTDHSTQRAQAGIHMQEDDALYTVPAASGY